MQIISHIDPSELYLLLDESQNQNIVLLTLNIGQWIVSESAANRFEKKASQIIEICE